MERSKINVINNGHSRGKKTLISTINYKLLVYIYTYVHNSIEISIRIKLFFNYLH